LSIFEHRTQSDAADMTVGFLYLFSFSEIERHLFYSLGDSGQVSAPQAMPVDNGLEFLDIVANHSGCAFNHLTMAEYMIKERPTLV
jgi:hypothetical protein